MAEAKAGLRLSAIDQVAARLGVKPGMALTDARALVPDLQTAQADHPGDLASLRQLGRWCMRYSPWVALERVALDGDLTSAGLCLDISGCGHLYGGAKALAADLLRRLQGFGLSASLALAPTPTAAWALARYGARPGECKVASAASLAPALAGLPIAALNFDPAGAYRLGLYRIGDLYALPRASLAKRFGPILLDRLDKALGLAPEAIAPLVPAPHFRLRLDFAEPIGADGIRPALTRLLAGLVTLLAEEGRGARRLELQLYRVDGGIASARIGTARPSRDARHLERLFAERLRALDCGFGVETAILAAETEPLAPSTPALIGDQESAKDDISLVLDRLRARLGSRSVLKLLPADSHIPERAASVRPWSAEGAAEGDFAGAWPDTGPPEVERPIRLLPVPEPVEAIAAPSGAPEAFRWRRIEHRIVQAEGPERIAPEWWREPDLSAPGSTPRRDYWRLEDETGRRFWLYRTLAADDGVPRWYVHGLFA